MDERRERVQRGKERRGEMGGETEQRKLGAKGVGRRNGRKSVEERWAEKTEQRKLGAKGVGRRNGRKGVEER